MVKGRSILQFPVHNSRNKPSSLNTEYEQSIAASDAERVVKPKNVTLDIAEETLETCISLATELGDTTLIGTLRRTRGTFAFLSPMQLEAKTRGLGNTYRELSKAKIVDSRSR